MSPLPGAVLFACTYNRVRSPMARALMMRQFSGRLFVESCALRRAETTEIDPFMLEVMSEIGLDLSNHRQKTFADLEDESFDLVVSLSPEAQHGAVELARNASTELLYWPTRDPTLVEGRRDQVIEAYRRTRDDLLAQIHRQFGPPSTFGG